MVGNYRNSATEHVLNVMDGLAWLAQASMFVVLGLLVTPSAVWESGFSALIIAGFLILVARPIAVFTSIKWFRYSKREIAYVSWVGLRGAVPVTLAMIPLVDGVPYSNLLFNVAFAVVILSLIIQGTTIPLFAKQLGMVLPPNPEPLETRDVWLARNLHITMQSFRVEKDSEAEHSHPYAMTRKTAFTGSRLFSLVRKHNTVNVNMATQMQAGDIAWYVLPENLGEDFAEQFASTKKTADEQAFYGEFTLHPQAKVSDLATVYGIHLGEDETDLTLAQLFRRRFGDVPVAGDRIDLDGGMFLIVKELDERSFIHELGLKMPKANGV